MKCIVCEKETKNKKYCSRDCTGIARRNRIKIKCQYCGIVKEYKASQKERRFCSKTCGFKGRKKVTPKDHWDWKRILKINMKSKDKKEESLKQKHKPMNPEDYKLKTCVVCGQKFYKQYPRGKIPTPFAPRNRRSDLCCSSKCSKERWKGMKRIER